MLGTNGEQVYDPNIPLGVNLDDLIGEVEEDIEE